MSDNYSYRQAAIRNVIIFSALLLIGKIMYIQLFDNSIKARANSIAIDKNTIYPSRGLIYDRNDKILNFNSPIYDLMVTYNQLDSEMDTSMVCEILDITKEDFLKRINKNFNNHRYSRALPFIFMTKLSPEKYARLQENLFELPGFSIVLRNIRGYPDTIAAHVLGYISEVNSKQIKKEPEYYNLGDYIGSTGLESYYERSLRGQKGKKYMLKDNLGRVVSPYQAGDLDSVAVSGVDINVGLDKDLQRLGESLMQNKIGGIVALDPRNGEILAMISAPTYDPNVLAIHRGRGEAYKKMSTNPTKPLFNRAIGAKYPPGSLLKPIVALIGLQEEVWTANRGVTCNGGYQNFNIFMGCHHHPYVSNVSQAIQYSCNSYFFTLYRAIIDKEGYYNSSTGLNVFNKYLYQMGFGQKLGLDFIGEKAGNVPTVAYFDKLYNKKWRSPTIISLGIGQGELELTTLQMANLAAIIGNRGFFYTPHLLKKYKNSNRQIDAKYRLKREVDIDPELFIPIIDGMEKVISSGTGQRAKVNGIKICGKTGTAQNTNRNGKDHSIFFAFAPKENPKIAIAVYIENAGFGGTYAAPIAGLMIEKYLNGEISELKLPLKEQLEKTVLIDPSVYAKDTKPK